MKELFNFLQEIFLIKQEDKIFVGLSQFKYSKAPVVEKKQPQKKSEVKISDLMRRSL